MKTQLKADLMLVLVCAFWGSSCLFTKLALEDLQEFNLIAVRFLIGFAVGWPIFFVMGKLKTDKKAILYSALLSANYFLVLGLMTFGVMYTSVSKAGFLTCLAGAFVPVIGFFAFKKKPDKKTVFCVVTTLIGVYLLTMGGTVDSGGINLGDVLCTLCSLFFAVHIMLVGFIVKRVDAITLTVYLMGFTGFYNLIATFIFETPQLPSSGASWINVLWLSIICSVCGALFQNIAQKYTTDTHAGIIFTLEPVFAVLFAYAFLRELLTFWGYVGAVILLASIVLLEVELPRLRGRSQ